MEQQVYCVMDMPLTVIKNFLNPQVEMASKRKPFITTLAADCLRQVANQPEDIINAVLEGELPLYRFCRSLLH